MKFSTLVRDVVLVGAFLVSVAAAVAIVMLHIGFAPVLSGSMEPSFAAGDVVLTEAVDRSSLTPGDIVILPLPDGSTQHYVHRIVTAKQSSGGLLVTTRGDNNPTADNWALEITSTTAPKVVGVIPRVGFLQPPTRQ